MNALLTTQQKNDVLSTMAQLINSEQASIVSANTLDVEGYNGDDLAMEKRLKVDDAKIAGMILSLKQLVADSEPIGKELFNFIHENGIKIVNKTAPFGTVLIIYESRPDVTVEAAGIAFKSGNKILLKGGKESLNSNLKIVELWHKALKQHNISTDWVEYLNYDRVKTQEFLENPTQQLDLIVPRGGEKLIEFVKKNAKCPVIVSGRGNNFVYVDSEADIDMALNIINNGKTSNISVCNAVDKVLINSNLENKDQFIKALVDKLLKSNVEIFGDAVLSKFDNISAYENESIWYQEFLDYKIVIGSVDSTEEAISKSNKYSGGHSAVIITKNDETAETFMENTDCAAVYQNASSRFTDGGQFGLGGELAISTDKLHHRGPMGLHHLVTNKWYVKGNGQIR
ncbi:glutamate-5-semialdehyde dehydrogenase [uncultured Lutibacter sp.]|uniref:glutamate-5-semialdehyde dehydrogenase n=1 Tax=uncultured Lutibacter sp. TaxID=437739 RepID=UPI0026065C5F|nr:glutamate-5-semialdehyde dehydrogenase [uncultured Lutibacter sp.]